MPRRRSLRIRLAAGSVLATSAVVLLLAIAGYAAVAANVRGDIDADLQQQSRRIPPELLGAERRGPFGGRPGFGRGVFVAQLVDATGEIVAQTDGAAGIGGLPEPELQTGDRDEDGRRARLFRTERIGGERFRILETARSGAVLQVAVPLDRSDQFLGRLRLLLVPALAISVLLTVLASQLVARLALQPVAGMTASARRIRDTGDLDERVEPAFDDPEFVAYAEALGEMLGSLAVSREAQRQFVADASHELRTPLTSLRGNADFLARNASRDGDGGPAAEAAAALVRDVDRIAELADALITLARLDAAPPPALEPVDVRALVDREVRRLRELNPDHSVEFVSAEAGASAVGTAVVDAELLRRIVGNLVDNACRYSPGGSTVSIDLVRLDGDVIELVVEDDGPGLPLEDRRQVFERFRRGSGTASGVRGTGLGLAIVRQSARALGGDAVLEPVSPHGLRCRVTVLDQRSA